MAKEREEEETISGLSKLLGTAGKRAVKAHSGDEVEIPSGGFIDLPAGIRNGIAQLASFKIGKYKSGDNEGKPFWMASGVVLSPKTVMVDGEKVNIEGARTKIGPNPLCDTVSKDGTKSSLDDKMKRMLNELRKFGVDTSEMTEPDDAEQGWINLVEEAPYFKFDTWSKKKLKKTDPDPIVNETWKGIAEDYEGSDEDDVEEFDESELDAEAADSGDEEAQLAIANYAKKYGIDASSDDYSDFASVMEAVNSVISKKGSGKKMAKKVTGKKSPAKASNKKKQLTNEELGAIVDEQEDGYEEAGQALVNIAGEYDLDPDDFDTWAELGVALDEATTEGGDEEVEYEEEEEEGEEEESLGELADGGDKKAIKQLTAAAEEAELDPDDYKTWVKLEEALAELEGEGEDEEEEETEEEEESESTYEELGELADDDDAEAVETLTEAAAENELDPDDFATWTELGMELDSLGSGEEEEEEESDEEFVPEKGETYQYKPEGSKKAIEAEVTYVNAKAETVTLKTAAGKIVKNVSFEELMG